MPISHVAIFKATDLYAEAVQTLQEKHIIQEKFAEVNKFSIRLGVGPVFSVPSLRRLPRIREIQISSNPSLSAWRIDF